MNSVIRYFLILLFLAVSSGCAVESTVKKPSERAVFLLGDNFDEITQHAERKKSVPDMDMLLRVSLPDNPSKQEVVNYVNLIFTLSRNQRTYLSSDPQVGMLAQIGHEHLDVLLNASKPGVQWSKYGIEAITILANESDKQLIIDNVQRNYELSKVVYAKKWCADAKEVLHQLVKRSTGYLPTEALMCLAQAEDPKTYPALISFLVNGWNSHSTYNAIKTLPGIDLREALPRAWEKSRPNRYQIGYLTPDALELGYLPAFHFLFETIDNNYGVPETIYNSYALIKRFTDLPGYTTKKGLKEWYAAHKNQIYFDSGSGYFVAR